MINKHILRKNGQINFYGTFTINYQSKELLINYWTQKNVTFLSSDKCNFYTEDNSLTKRVLLFAYLSSFNHNADNKDYSNHLNSDTNTLLRSKLIDFDLTTEEQNLLQIRDLITEVAITAQSSTPAHNDLNDNLQLDASINALEQSLNEYYKKDIEPLLLKNQLL